MISYGWYVDIIQMKGRKLNWTPHMTVRYLTRTSENNSAFVDNHILSQGHIPSQDILTCNIVIADTRSGHPQDWHMRYQYFNVKATQSYNISFGLREKQYPVSSMNIDEYFGTCLEEFNNFKQNFNEYMTKRGFTMNQHDFTNVMNEIEKQLKNDNNNQAMEIDIPEVHRIR
jgi:hypothetical protein